MAITFTFGDLANTTFTLDESAGLQNATATPAQAGDANDDDIQRTSLPGEFNTLLFSTMALDPIFPDGGRIAQSTSDFLVVSDTSITDISLAGQFDAGTGTAAPLAAYTGNFANGGLTGLTTTDGEEIRLFSDYFGAVAGDTDVEDGDVVFGIDSSGDIVFAIYMTETVIGPGEVHLQFSWVTFEAIAHPTPGDGTGGSHDEAVDLGDFLSIVAEEVSGFNFAGVPPGKSMHLTAAALSGEGGVIVTPLTEVVQINTSNADPSGVIGFGSQGINAGETVAMTWVASGLDPNLTIPNLDQNEADLATNIKFATLASIDEASFTIMQKVGSKTAAVKITALDTNTENGSGDGDFFDNVGNAATVGGAGDDTIVSITSVTFTRGATTVTLTTDGTFGATGVTANFIDAAEALASGGAHFEGQVIITGVDTGDVISYTTLTDHERLLVTGVSGNVDIGGFSTSQSSSAAMSIGEAFQIEDDGPVLDLALKSGAELVLDESPGDGDEATGYLAQNSIPAGDLFTAAQDAGTDELDASSTTYEFDDPGIDAPSGLTDSLSGEAVVYNLVGDAIIGTISGGVEVIRYEIDALTGEVTASQSRAVLHLPNTDPTSHDESLTHPGTGLIVVTKTIFDNDGDDASDSVDITNIFKIEDDGPSVTVVANGAVDVFHDETPGVDTGTEDDDVAGSSLPAAFLTAFNSVSNTGDDPNVADSDDDPSSTNKAIGFAASGAALVTVTPNFGSDGQAASNELVYALALGPADTNGNVDSGLDTTDGEDIFLVEEGGLIVGRIDDNSDPTDGIGGVAAFAIGIDSETGEAFTAQWLSVLHNDTSSSDETAALTNGAVLVNVTVKDGDLDIATNSAAVGSQIGFGDDGPAALAGGDLLLVHEDALTGGNSEVTVPAQTLTATGNLADQVAGGSDGVKSFGLKGLGDPINPADPTGDTVNDYLTGLGLTSGTVALVYSVNQVVGGDDTLTATKGVGGDIIFTVVVEENGDVTGTLSGTLDHPQSVVAGQPDEDVITIDLTDLLEGLEGDNDPITFLTNALVLVVEDDAPDLTVDDTSVNAANAAATYSTGAQGDWSDDAGSDGLDSLDVTFNSYQIGAQTVVTHDGTSSTFAKTDDFTFAGSITDDFNGDGVDDTVTFTLTFDPVNNVYDLDVDTPPGSVTTFDTSQGSLAPGGPDAVQTLLFSGSDAGNDDIVFFGAVATAVRSDPDPTPPPPYNSILDLVERGEPDLTEAEIEALLPLPDLVNADTQMNVSTAGIGIANNNLDSTASTASGTGAFLGTTITPGDESFVVNPETLVDSVKVYISSTVQGYDTASEDLYFTVYYEDGTTSGPTEVTAGMLTHYANNDKTVPKEAKGGSSFEIDGGDNKIDAIQLTMGQGTVKIPIIEFTVDTIFDPESLDLDFTAAMFDGDEDSDSDDFSIQLEPDVA